MKYDFTSIIDRHGRDSIAVDGLKGDGFSPAPPKEGFDAIPMWVADMNFPTVPTIQQAIIERASHPAFGYFEAPPEYYKAIIRWQETRHGVTGLKPRHIGYENGVLGGVISALNCICSRGDNVLVHSPTYIGFTSSLKNNGYEAVHSPLVRDENGIWRMDYADMEKQLREKKIHAAILCNPHNPCGRVWERWELEKAMELYRKYDVYVITDEVYEHIVYAPHTHTYFATLPGMWERTISCSSLSKTYSITGWRLGYIIAPAEIIDRAKKVHDFLTVGAAAPLQEAVIPGLKFGQDYYDDFLAKYTHKKELFLKGLDDLHIVHNDPEGAYYVLMDVSEFGYDSDLKFCEDLARLVGVGAVSGSSFFREPVNHLIRFHFAKKDETLLEALNRLEGLRAKIPSRKKS